MGNHFPVTPGRPEAFTTRKDIVRYVQQVPDDISWIIDQAEFDDLLAVLTDSAPGPDGIPYGVYKCAGGLGSSFVLIKLYWKEVLFLIVL